MDLTGHALLLLSAAALFLIADSQDFSKYDEYEAIVKSVQEDISKKIAENRRISESRERESKPLDEFDGSLLELRNLLGQLEAGEYSFEPPLTNNNGYSTESAATEPTESSTIKSAGSTESLLNSPTSYGDANPEIEELGTSTAKSVSLSTELRDDESDDLLSLKHPDKVDSQKGIPGEDFPDYTDIPTTAFSCSNKPIIPGFYADLDANCQVFHVCWPERQETFLCPVGTTFNQSSLACDSWYGNNCSLAHQYYNVNMGDTGLHTSEDNHEGASSIIDVLLDPSTVEPSKLEDASKLKPKIAASALSFVSKFLPIKATVTAYTEPKEQYSETESTSVDDGEESSMYEDGSFLKRSMKTDYSFKIHFYLQDKIDQELVKAVEDLDGYFAPLLQGTQPDSDMLKYRYAYTSIIAKMRHFLRLIGPVDQFIIGTGIWPGWDVFFISEVRQFRVWLVQILKSAISKLLFEKWGRQPIDFRPGRVVPTKKPMRNFTTTPLSVSEFKAMWYLYRMGLRTVLRSVKPPKNVVSIETMKAILKNYLKFFKMNAISFLYNLK